MTLRALPALLLFLFPACAQPEMRALAGTTPSPPEVRAQIERLNEGMMAAFDAGDRLGVAGFYADDAWMVGGSDEVRGRAAIDAYWEGWDTPGTWQLEVFDLFGDDTIVVQTGRSTIRRVVDGEERSSIVDFVLVWELQEDGDYRILVDAYN